MNAKLIVLWVSALAAGAGSLLFLYRASRPSDITQLARPRIGDVAVEIIAPGVLEPLEEVEVKPRVSGILTSCVLEPGDRVKKGDLIGTVEIVPDLIAINTARSELESQRARERDAQRRVARGRELAAAQAITSYDLERLVMEHEIAREAVAGQVRQLELLQRGAAQDQKYTPTQIISTVEGTVLRVPVKVGSSVTQPNNFSDGTSIAVIADLSRMVFRGHVDELDVDKLKEGLPVEIEVAAIAGERLRGELVAIAPKRAEPPSGDASGATRFQIEVQLQGSTPHALRAGYNANAHILLDSRHQVLTLDEGLIHFDDDRTAWVDIKSGPTSFERRPIQLGLSDGSTVEVVSGIGPDALLRTPQAP